MDLNTREKLFRAFGSPFLFLTDTRGVAPGYYISRRWREDYAA